MMTWSLWEMQCGVTFADAKIMREWMLSAMQRQYFLTRLGSKEQCASRQVKIFFKAVDLFLRKIEKFNPNNCFLIDLAPIFVLTPFPLVRSLLQVFWLWCWTWRWSPCFRFSRPFPLERCCHRRVPLFRTELWSRRIARAASVSQGMQAVFH